VARADQTEPGLGRLLAAPAPRAVLIIKRPCNPKSVVCCIAIAIQQQEGLKKRNAYARHMPGICLVKELKTRKGYSRHMPNYVEKNMTGI
jgi:hypothetical protein